MAKISTLIDDFQDGVIDTSKWQYDPGVVETGGRLQITPSTSFPAFGSVYPRVYDLTNSHIVAHIPVITPNGSTGTLQSEMAVDASPDDNIRIRKTGSQLVCSKKVGGTTTQLSFTPYSATNHLYWRIRSDSSNVYWETSATGSGTFTIQHTENIATLGFAITVVGVYFRSGYSGFEASPGTFQIESVNPGLPIAASGASTSSGTAILLLLYKLSASGASTSSGSAAITIPPLTAHALSASGASTSVGSASIIIIPVVADTHQITASGESLSSGSASFFIAGDLSASGASYSNGTAAITVIQLVSAPSIYTFSPPVVHDVPPTLPGDPRNRLARWYNNRPRGRTVLKLTSSISALYPLTSLFPEDNLFPLETTGQSTYVTVDNPTSDQVNAAAFAYMGGRIYLVSEAEAQNLLNAGYSVTVETIGEVIVVTPAT